MKTVSRGAPLLGLALLALPACAMPDLVFLVRHAERASEPAGDPDLTAAGEARAQQLAVALADAGLRQIITSQFRRSQQTAAALARRAQLPIVSVAAGRGDAGAHVRAVHAVVQGQDGGALLIVGHSNTVPAIIEALGGPALPELCESSYQHIFVLRPGAPAPLARLRYGEPSPASAAGCL